MDNNHRQLNPKDANSIWYDIQARNEVGFCEKCLEKGRTKHIWHYWHISESNPETKKIMTLCGNCFFGRG
jgi:hypothetical protein